MNAVARAKSVVLAVVGVVLAALIVSGSAAAASAAGTASLSGTVIAEGGGAVSGASVSLYVSRSWGWSYVESTQTDSTGAYGFDALDAGSYTLEFAPGQGQNLLPEWWNDKPNRDAATAVALADGQSIGGLAATLTAGATISGTVSSTLLSGGPSSISAACAVGQTTHAASCDFDIDVDGSYRLVALPADTYKISFGGQGGCGEYQVGSESLWTCNREIYWDSKPGSSSATLLALAHQEQRTGVNQDFDTVAGVSIYPKISGTAAVGKKLTAARGSWETGTRVLYQWRANDVPIARATASTFTPTAAQLGKTISVYVFGLTQPSTAGSYDTWESTGWTMSAKVAAGTLSSSTPKITGTLAVGRTVTAKPGTWTSGTDFRYQWLANGKAITGATKATLKLTSAQAGKSISVRVAGVKSGYTTKRVTSTATLKVIVAATPTITGTTTVGKKLTAKPGTWTAGTTLSYRWYAGGKAISGATKSTLTLSSAQRGKTVVVKVTGKKSGYASVTTSSTATAKVR